MRGSILASHGGAIARMPGAGGVLRRHRAFLAGCHPGRRVSAWAGGLARVLRVPRAWQWHQHAMALRVAVQAPVRQISILQTRVLERSAPAVHTQNVQRMVRERWEHTTRLHTRNTVHTQPGKPTVRTLVSTRIAPDLTEVQTQLLRRVEHAVAYPRLSATVAQPQGNAAARKQAAAAAPAQLTQAVSRAQRSEPAAPAQAQNWTLPMPELARVTEHVIGEISHRALSFRERSGQY